jgi:GNAT superfamily N-acetyltransferase
MDLCQAESERDLEDARALFREYAGTLDFDLCFQDFERELRDLPADYAPPKGCLLLAREHGEAIGCVAMRPLDPNVCEMKRLYVKPRHRGCGIGRRLVEAIISAARVRGYDRMRHDTVPAMMAARRLYESAGFVSIEAYRHNPIPGALYCELNLREASGTG